MKLLDVFVILLVVSLTVLTLGATAYVACSTTACQCDPFQDDVKDDTHNDTVLDLVAVLNEEHNRVLSLRGELARLRSEAQELFTNMLNEINRLKAAPRLQTGDKTAGE